MESFRKLRAHCDPLNLYTGANKLMKVITDMGHVCVSTIDDILAALKETKKRIAEYEERVTVLPNAKTTWIPSMLTELMDEEVLTHMEMDNSQNDLETIIKSVEALRVIKRSVTRKGGQLRQLATEGPSQDAEDDEEMTLDEIAAAIADPAVPRDQLLAALGKGGGKGASSGPRPFRFPLKPGAKTSSQQPHQQKQQQVRPPQTGAAATSARTETRRCFNG